MKANELRIGNYVVVMHNVKKVTQILEKGLNCGSVGCLYSLVEPIPLTEKWLERFGFENYSINCDSEGYNHIDVSFHNESVTIYLNDCEIAWIKHVHQLQNLFYCLCGEELELKP